MKFKHDANMKASLGHTRTRDVTVLYISDGFHTTPFAIIASHTISQRVSDRSVALAASCSSGCSSGIRELHNLIVRGKCISREESNSNKT